jgi:hypothetical protein
MRRDGNTRALNSDNGLSPAGPPRQPNHVQAVRVSADPGAPEAAHHAYMMNHGRSKILFQGWRICRDMDTESISRHQEAS